MKTKKIKIIVGGMIIGLVGVATILLTVNKQKLIENINLTKNQDNNKLSSKTIAMYKSEDGTNYTEIEGRMPDSGYIINEEKSYCNLNGEKDTKVILKTVDGNHVISNLIKGDKCYLYFDKKTTETVNTALGPIEVQLAIPDFSKTAPNDIEGIFATEDGMYGGTSYYWRGAITNNYVKFAGICWRIIRINGDGSIRLIYDGTTCHENGQNTTESIATASVKYNSSASQSNYVGWTYIGTSQRTLGGTASNAKTKLEEWYKTNITDKGYGGKVASGKYCNDRDAQSGSAWAINGSTFYYAAYKRIYTDRQPTLSCPSDDTYTLSVGLITADEVMYAGGLNTNNSSYYLYNGQNYWTMSSYNWYGTFVCVFCVNRNGNLGDGDVNGTRGLRPVINLESDTQFKGGTTGTLNNPYEVI